MTTKALLSYSWDDDAHKKWVEDLAARLRGDGIETILDQWHLVPGASLPQFMETAVRENDFILNVCTQAYKSKADSRVGGVGYESDLMTGEKLVDKKREKFLPVLRAGSWSESLPSWLKGVYGFDLSGAPYMESEYKRLVDHLLGRRPGPPPVGSGSMTSSASPTSGGTTPTPTSSSAPRQQNVYNHGSVTSQVNVQGGVVNLQLPPVSKRK